MSELKWFELRQDLKHPPTQEELEYLIDNSHAFVREVCFLCQSDQRPIHMVSRLMKAIMQHWKKAEKTKIQWTDFGRSIVTLFPTVDDFKLSGYIVDRNRNYWAHAWPADEILELLSLDDPAALDSEIEPVRSLLGIIITEGIQILRKK